MCGIFGYVGPRKDAATIVFEGLKLLEYRGYDSWGVGVQANGKTFIDKHIGKIGNAKLKLPSGNFSFGHTRWATHGGVTDVNAHPHLDCTGKIAVVHNGIVENYQEIKKLLAPTHRIISETDTELVAHLIEQYRKKYSLLEAVRLAAHKLRGLSAFLIAEPSSKTLVAVKAGPPLVVGIGKKENVVSSDVNSLLPLTRNILFLENDQLAEITGTTVKLFSIKTGRAIKPKIQKITWKETVATKGDYEYFMLKEIYEQPRVIENIALNYRDQIETLARMIEKARGTFFIGAGTAFCAGFAGVYLFSKIAGKHINISIASEFNYLEDFLTSKSLVIALSQSGETIDVIEPLNRAKRKGSVIAAITNVLGSTIYRMADYKILTGAGPERAVASTKAYISKLAILLMLAFANKKKIKNAESLLLEASKEITRILTKKNLQTIRKIALLLKSVKHLYVIGRGVSYPSAIEAALKIKEVSYIHTEGLAGGELKHGTLALFSKGTPCIVFAPQDETYETIISNAIEIKSRGGLIIGISPKDSPVFDHWIEVKNLQEASIIAQIVPMQLLAYHLAIEKGLDPDKPRNLAKSVTVK